MTRLTWEQIENDCLAILTYYSKICRLGEGHSTRKAEVGTGVPRKTIEKYMRAYEYVKSTKPEHIKFDKWWLGMIADKYHFSIKYIGKPTQKIWVQKEKYNVYTVTPMPVWDEGDIDEWIEGYIFNPEEWAQ
jgi:hypothetical protein